MKKFRLLNADEIECRVAICKDNGVSILLYKTARTDADLLDETVGPEYWENDFKLVDGVLYGGIGVDFAKSGKLVWKWDAGTESNTEAEKGRASDAFKRAGFKHGIGRELYSAPFIWIGADKCSIKPKGAKYQCDDDFTVMEIGYDAQERINKLIIGIKGNIVWSMGAARPVQRPAEPPREAERDTKFRCADCGKVLEPYPDKNGVMVSLRKHAQGSEARFGKVLCLECIEKNYAD